ncbi:MAG: hypothetical protein M1448_02970 [Candidatus Marsarchaeota archaeon]|jgi:hypothetical protein|nr:hypothetical protein [Candidatus Marsarchaeota archaeon]
MLGIMRSIAPISFAASLFFANISSIMLLSHDREGEAMKRHGALFYASIALYLLSLSLLVV